MLPNYLNFTCLLEQDVEKLQSLYYLSFLE